MIESLATICPAALRPLRRGRGPAPALAGSARRHQILLAALAGFVLAAGPMRSQTTIDAYTSAVPQTAQPNTEAAATVVGGFRDVRSNNAANTATANGGRFTCAGTANFQGCTVQYDGNDGDPFNFTPDGFAATDFTAGGHDRIRVATFVAAGACNLFVEICDDDSPTSQCENVSVAGIVNGGTVTIAYDDFGPGLDFANVTALQFNLTPTVAPVDCAIGALSTSGLFADGFETGTVSAWSTSS